MRVKLPFNFAPMDSNISLTYEDQCELGTASHIFRSISQVTGAGSSQFPEHFQSLAMQMVLCILSEFVVSINFFQSYGRKPTQTFSLIMAHDS